MDKFDHLKNQFQILRDDNDTGDDLKTTDEISSKINFQKSLFFILLLFLSCVLFTYYIVDRKYYTEKEDKFSYKKFFRVSFYVFLGNILYIIMLYYMICQYRKRIS
jgi:hypothetical protein